MRRASRMPRRIMANSAGEAMRLRLTLGESSGLAERRVTWPRLCGCRITTPTWKLCASCLVSPGNHRLASMRTGLHISWMSGCSTSGVVRNRMLQLLIWVAKGPLPKRAHWAAQIAARS